MVVYRWVVPIRITPIRVFVANHYRRAIVDSHMEWRLWGLRLHLS